LNQHLQGAPGAAHLLDADGTAWNAGGLKILGDT
jgi:hypothetical protein